MRRRDFAKVSSIAIGTGLLMPQSAFADNVRTNFVEFPLHFAPHIGMFESHAGTDPVAQLEYMAQQGFTAFEDNEMKSREVRVQNAMTEAMQRLNIRMGVFVAHKIYWKEPNLTNGKEDLRQEFLAGIKSSVDVAKRVNAKWMTVVPGHVDSRLDMGYQTANVIESLKRACEILEPHGLIIVLEPLNFYNHPGLFLTRIPQAYEICRAVSSPSCKILFDIYHQQVQEGNLIPNMEMAWDEIAYFQIGDNPGRNEPTTGEINYLNIFKYIHSKGYNGILGMEHGNSTDGKDGELAVIEAYKTTSTF